MKKEESFSSTLFSKPVIERFFKDSSSLPEDWIAELRHSLVVDYLQKDCEFVKEYPNSYLFPEYRDQVEELLRCDPLAQAVAEQYKIDSAQHEEYVKSPEYKEWLKKTSENFMKLARVVTAKPNGS